MPPVTRSRKQTKKSAEFCVLIDKTPRNITTKPVRTAGKDKPNPKPKPKQKALRVAPAPPAEAKSKAKYKRPAKASSIRVEAEGETTAQRSDVGGPEDPLPRVLPTELPVVFATPPRSQPPLRPPKLPEHRSHDPKTTIPPQFHYDGTPSPEPRRRRSHVAPPRASSLLPPSSPIQLSSSPARQDHNDPVERDSIFLSAHLPGSPSQFRTPTRKDRKRKRTPLSRPHLQSEGEVNNDDLFAHGVIDDLDEREDSIDWENAGSDKENDGGPPEFLGSDKLAPSMPFTSERGILQPREASHTPVRSGGSDPFGIVAAERLLKARRAETILGEPEAGPSNKHRGPRRPLGELPADEVASITQSVEIAASRSPSLSLPSPAPPYRRYSDSEIEDLYLPASPPHTPRQRLPHGHVTPPDPETTPVAATAPLTPRNGDSARAFTVRKRRQKELHGVSEHGSEIEGSSAPSSPSPVKRVHQRLPDSGSQLDYDGQESEADAARPPKKPRLRAKGKGKENARGKRSMVEDPTEAARRVLENAPLRRATATRKRKTTSNPVGGNDGVREEQTRPARGRRTTRGAVGQASRKKKGSRGSRPRKKEDESTPEDLRETRKQERAKRIEYFKQLDGYKLPKENVYVI